jgi:hypothetical protein
VCVYILNLVSWIIQAAGDIVLLCHCYTHPALPFVLLFTLSASDKTLLCSHQDDENGILQVAGYVAFVEAFFIFTSLEALPIFLNERSVFGRYTQGYNTL